MPIPPGDFKSPHLHVLEKARDLAEQVRQAAERVHQQAIETYRLTEISRRHSERGRELSRTGREEARAVQTSINWSLYTAQRGGRRSSGNDED